MSDDLKYRVLGEHDVNAIAQMDKCVENDGFVAGALMADGHLGYTAPIGSVLAFDGRVSPGAVGYDIACGNKAVMLDVLYQDVQDDIGEIMDDIWASIPFGVGSEPSHPIEHPVLDDPGFDGPVTRDLKDLAAKQLGSVGAGNHYVDLFHDEDDHVWIGVHFGSRGFGHKIATHYVKLAGGNQGMNADMAFFDVDSDDGREYLEAMALAGKYAYAGRDIVCEQVAEIVGAFIVEGVHNHHNFAWVEDFDNRKLWVHRKGATPARHGQRGFVGGSMGDVSYIVEGVEGVDSASTLYSTVHGAGRVMSRTQAAGKTKYKNGRRVRVSEGAISQEMRDEWMSDFGDIELRGGGLDESPQCYRRLPEVISAQGDSVRVVRELTPIGVAMAG